MKKTIILYVLQFIIVINSFSQEIVNLKFSISGTVIDSTENKASEFTNIALLSAVDSSFVKSATCNDNGEFSVSNVDAGEYIIRINSVSFKTVIRKILLDKNLNLQILLQKNDLELGNVTVTGSKELYKLEPDKRVYLTANDESIQSAFAEDALENAPGTYIDIDGNVIIRGEPATVWINSRPISRKGENLSNYLKLLPASRIEKIEVITNPSAKYSATNTSSILNIVLKKKTYDNSLIAVGTVLNTNGTAGLFATAFITKEKFDYNIYFRGTGKRTDFNKYDKSYLFSNSDTSFYSENTIRHFQGVLGAKVYNELIYRFNDKSDININLGLYNHFSTDSFNSKIIRRYDNPYLLNTEVVNAEKNSYYVFNMNFNHNFSKVGHLISLNLSNYMINVENDFFRTQFDFASETTEFRKSKPTDYIFSLNFNADYIYPINDNFTFETGFDISPVSDEIKKDIVNVLTGLPKNWNENSMLSSNYKESVPYYQVFTTISGKISVIKFKAGLRYENNSYFLEEYLTGENITKNYPGFYPSLHLSYETKKKHSFSLSYSKRAKTPIYNLNPYIDRTYSDYISSGNQNLEFAGTNSFEFIYYKRSKKISTNISVYQRNTKNDIIRVSKPVFDAYYDKNVILQTYENCAYSKFTGTEISISTTIAKKLKIRFYNNTYFQDLKGTYNNLPLRNKSFVYTTKLIMDYKFFDKFSVKVNTYYMSDKADVFQNTTRNFFTNVAVSADFFDKKLSLNIKAKDIFKTKNMISEYTLNDFYHYSETNYIFRKVQFILIYRIGNSKYDRNAKVNQLAR